MGLTAQVIVGTLGGMAANKETARYAAAAKRLVDAMRRSGVKPKDIVATLGVDKETVRLWTTGERMAKDENLKRLAKMVGVDVKELRYGEQKSAALPQLQGEHVTDEDELRLLQAYRGLKKEWAREALRRRAVELLEEFGEPGSANPFGSKAGTQ